MTSPAPTKAGRRIEIIIKLLFAGIIQLVLKKKKKFNHVLLVPSEWKELNFLNVAL